jgi:predicted DNA-binding protein YlxM (UPF0122 family)
MDDFVVRGNLYELYGGLLNENQRKVYEYHIIDDMSFTEIGEEMDMWTAEFLKYFAVRKVDSPDKID